MSDDKNKVTDKAGEIAKNIWLAGVGAYGKAVDEAQGRLEKAAAEPPKLFRDLVKAGTQLEEEATEARAAAKNSVEERISRVRENFHNQLPARIEDISSLHKKVDRLSRKIDALTRALEEQGIAAKPATKKTPARKAAASKKKAAVKKAPARKKSPAARR